jgi:hemerythrin-like metal-binding protein
MKKIVWKDEFSVGVTELDLQHQKIIKVINQLIDKPRIFFKSQNISPALSELTNYVSEHFLLEEQLLEENGYQDLLEHSKRHTAYSRQITDFCAETLHRKKEVPSELLNFLTHWWTNHILHEDMKYKSFFEEKGIK